MWAVAQFKQWRTWLRIVVVAVIILGPVIAVQAYQWWTELPDEVAIATGALGGRYREVAEELGQWIKNQFDVDVSLVHTEGSLENLRKLEAGEVGLALYQPGTHQALGEPGEAPPDSVALVANLYLQPVHFIVRREASLRGPSDLRGQVVNLGLKRSGDYAMSLVLLEYFGLEQDSFEIRHLDYERAADAFEKGDLDAMLATIGSLSPRLIDLIARGVCELLEVPHPDGLAWKRLFVQSYTLPAGAYGASAHPIPPRDIKTVAVAAQLLTHQDTDTDFVERVARIVHQESFLRDQRLRELYIGGKDFSRRRSEFPMHRGAENFHDPQLRPVLDAEFVEATEGIRSFVVSLAIAGFLLYRWLRRRRERRIGHQLDKFIHSLLDIERRQLGLDDERARNADVEPLQRLLDEVTVLRQNALAEFSAYEVRDDPSAACFVEMCHALSNKINAKISRQRLDQAIEELAEAIRSREATAL